MFFSKNIGRTLSVSVASLALLSVSIIPAGAHQFTNPAPKPAYEASASEVAKFPWLDTSLSPEKRADLLVNAMNEDQLVHMLHGSSSLIGTRTGDDEGPNSIGYIGSIPELRVPALVLTDGPSGLRNREPATQMPAPVTQAASFNTDIAELTGKVIAQDAKDRGQDVLFGPGFNLVRVPKAGRNFEYFGEDPYLAGKIAASNVRGLQNEGVMATLKHFVANNQELHRTLSSSNMDQRTLHEIYEKPFEIAVKDSNPASAMCAYNKINQVYACSNYDTLVRDLRNRMDFTGFVVSDYPATHAATDIKNGLNVELPSSKHTTKEKILEAIEARQLSWDDVRVRVRETLVQMFRFGLFDHPWNDKTQDRVRVTRDIPKYRGYEAALKVAEEGAVLLKNDGILPLKASDLKHKRILVVGEGAKNAASGGGSSQVISLVKDNFLDELKKKVEPFGAKVEWRSEWNPAGVHFAARRADVVIVVTKTMSTEFLDRLNLDYFPHMNNAVNIAAKANKNVVVVSQIPGPTLMPWENKVDAILNVWYPGAAGGKATANILFGDVNPSGRLPITFPASNEVTPVSSWAQYPGLNGGFEPTYSEGVFMGYRWYDQKNIKPAYVFGYGLSYTNFEYSQATLNKRAGMQSDTFKVSFKVKNTGRVAGAVAPQVYVGKPSSKALPTPPKELAGFTKVYLQPGESKVVTLEIAPDQLEVFDSKLNRGEGDFKVMKGQYKVYVADNVNDVKATLKYVVK